MRPSPLIMALDHCWYPGITDNWDDEIFRERILARIEKQMTILDLGAGAGIVRQMDFRGVAARVCGVDVDPRVADNPLLHEARIGPVERLPWEGSLFDLVFADNVLEHLPAPELAFREIYRVLKPGGWFLAKTPNKWHYMPLVARMTPHRFHQAFNRRRGRAVSDTFPTRYRANSRRSIRKLAVASGLALERLSLHEGRPEYLRVSPVTYAAGLVYERLVNVSRWLEGLRIVMIVEMRRPASPPDSDVT